MLSPGYDLSNHSPRSVAEGGAEGAMSDRRERAGAPAQGRRSGGTPQINKTPS